MFQDPIQVTIVHVVFISSSWLHQFLRISLFLITLTFGKVRVRYFVESLSWALFDIFLMIILDLYVFMSKTTELGLAHHTVSRLHTINMTELCCC